MPIDNIAYAAKDASAVFEPWKYQLRDLKDDDVLIEVKYCGICHSDIHMAKNEWGATIYPIVPGHEFTGIVSKVGPAVTKFQVGSRVGIGCVVGSCRSCSSCKENLEQYCLKGFDQTYSYKLASGEITYGGYGKYAICPQDYVLSLQDNMPLDRSAPLLCAGITTYSPIMAMQRRYNNRTGMKVGVVGLGGLGHMAVQFAKSLGHDVHVITRNNKKEELAKQLGATGIIISADDQAMAAHSTTFDYIIDTVSAVKDMGPYFNLLKVDGTLVQVGAPPVAEQVKVAPFSLITMRRNFMGSCVGGIAETQEMLNYCAEKNIYPMIESIPCSKITESYTRVLNADVRFRFVIDVGNTQATSA